MGLNDRVIEQGNSSVSNFGNPTSLGSNSQDVQASGNFVLPYGMYATNFGGATNFGNLGQRMVYAIPGEPGNGRIYARSEWGRSGRVRSCMGPRCPPRLIRTCR